MAASATTIQASATAVPASLSLATLTERARIEIRGGKPIVEGDTTLDHDTWSKSGLYADHFKEGAKGLGNIEDALKGNAALRESWVKASRAVYQMHNGEAMPASMDDQAALKFGLNYMREFNSALTTVDFGLFGGHGGMLNIARKVQSASDQQKQAFGYLMDTFDKASISRSGVWNSMKNMALDPTTYIGLGTLGVGTAIGAGTKLATKAGVRMLVKQALVVGAEGAAFSAGADRLQQNVNIDLGRQEKYSLTQGALSTGLGFVAGGAFSTVGTLGVRGVSRLTGRSATPSFTPEGFPIFNPGLNRVKLLAHWNVANWFPAAAMRPRSFHITRPVIRTMDEKFSSLGLAEKIRELNNDALGTLGTGGSAKDLINKFARDNATELAAFSTYIRDLRRHVETTYRTNAERVGSDRTLWSDDLTTVQKKALLAELDRMANLTDDLARGVRGENGRQILLTLRQIRNGELDASAFPDSITGLSDSHHLANLSLIRISENRNGTFQWFDGGKAAPVQVARALERSIDLGLYNPHRYQGKPIQYSELLDDNLERTWQNHILDRYAGRKEDGKPEIDIRGSVEEKSTFLANLRPFIETTYGHEAVFSVEQLTRLVQPKGKGDSYTFPTVTAFNRAIKESGATFSDYEKYYLDQISDILDREAKRGKGAADVTFWGIKERFFENNRPNRHTAESATYFFDFTARWAGTNDPKFWSFGTPVAKPGSITFMSRYKYYQGAFWRFWAGAHHDDPGVGNQWGRVIKDYKNPDIKWRNEEAKETGVSVARRAIVRFTSVGLVNDIPSFKPWKWELTRLGKVATVGGLTVQTALGATWLGEAAYERYAEEDAKIFGHHLDIWGRGTKLQLDVLDSTYGSVVRAVTGSEGHIPTEWTGVGIFGDRFEEDEEKPEPDGEKDPKKDGDPEDKKDGGKDDPGKTGDPDPDALIASIKDKIQNLSINGISVALLPQFNAMAQDLAERKVDPTTQSVKDAYQRALAVSLEGTGPQVITTGGPGWTDSLGDAFGDATFSDVKSGAGDLASYIGGSLSNWYTEGNNNEVTNILGAAGDLGGSTLSVVGQMFGSLDTKNKSLVGGIGLAFLLTNWFKDKLGFLGKIPFAGLFIFGAIAFGGGRIINSFLSGQGSGAHAPSEAPKTTITHSGKEIVIALDNLSEVAYESIKATDTNKDGQYAVQVGAGGGKFVDFKVLHPTDTVPANMNELITEAQDNATFFPEAYLNGLRLGDPKKWQYEAVESGTKYGKVIIGTVQADNSNDKQTLVFDIAG